MGIEELIRMSDELIERGKTLHEEAQKASVRAAVAVEQSDAAVRRAQALTGALWVDLPAKLPAKPKHS